MVKKCIYCNTEIPNESVIDFCHRCGIGVWGEKMFKAILQNMEEARDKGDLCHSQPFIGDSKKTSSNFPLYPKRIGF